jgi:hypothetical protein
MPIAGFNLGSPWPEVKEMLMENDLSLTDDDLDYQPGREEELLERLQKKMNKSKEEIQAYIESVSFNKAKSG